MFLLKFPMWFTRLVLILLCVPAVVAAQESFKEYTAERIPQPPKIDGDLDELIWQSGQVMNDYFQYEPTWGTQPDHPMELRIFYDDEAMYVGATLFDSAPDSIMGELGARDAVDLNADYIRICLDPYNKRQDAYFFGVYASGVQFDSKISDDTYDAVWESATKITPNGWSIEIKIPYSAIRFPKTEVQEWGLQVNRSVRRTREFVQWAKVPTTTSNIQLFWGTLKGISHVNPPLRLSFTPYVSAYMENSPVIDSEGSTTYANSFSYNMGADMKYGIDERFTLDVTLLPDFGQVKSDEKVKNLSYREVTYDENRPFFKESVELFDKNNLFYSRRIGQIPSGYYSVEGELQSGDKLEENPSSSKLLNAVKFSGRTDDGLGIGVFNAITGNTYATVKDSTGKDRDVITEPLINYNAIVFEQQLKNNSNFYFINTNVTRDKNFDDANVTGGGLELSNKQKTFAFEAEGAVSQQFHKITGEPTRNFSNTLGYKYSVGLSKLGGKFEYFGYRTVYDNNYYTSDLGYQAINSRIIYEFQVKHNMPEPWKIFRNSFNNIGYTYGTHFITEKPVINEIYGNLFATFLNYLSVFAGGGFTPGDSYDYFEPRTEGRYSKNVRYWYGFAGISSDYRKKFALDLNLNMSNFIDKYVSEGYNIRIMPRYRFNDNLTIKITSYFAFDPYNLGYADTEPNGNIIYGVRRLYTLENILGINYTFKNDMYISLNARHYWSTAEYRKYMTLLEDGELEDNYSYTSNNDFNYNAFNIDLLYSWQFAPGSNMSIVYKNLIESDDVGIVTIPTYSENLKKMFHDPQLNSLSIKILYYLDYQYIRKRLVRVN